MIERNVAALNARIETIARSCGRDPAAIRLVAVSKRFPASAIQEAYAAGQRLFGENYVQEAAEKQPLLAKDVRLHFIGHLQSNKAKIAAGIFTMIETVDRLKLAAALDRHLQALNRSLDVLVQVNIAGDAGKSGVPPEQAEDLVCRIRDLSRLRLRGLMTMPPFSDDPENTRPHFRNLRRLAETLQDKGLLGTDGTVELSMGMSHDFHVAIEEGATIIRIGTAIFGRRN